MIKQLSYKEWPMPKAGDIFIERIIFTKDGHVDAVDLHDERFGEAVFCRVEDRHYHGKLTNKKGNI